MINVKNKKIFPKKYIFALNYNLMIIFIDTPSCIQHKYISGQYTVQIHLKIMLYQCTMQ
jgi:hypothetical protein